MRFIISLCVWFVFVSRQVLAGQVDALLRIEERHEILPSFWSTRVTNHTCMDTHTHTHAWVFKMHLCTHGKQGHMHSGRYCYARIEIKLANAISFLPRAAGPICKHQTASLQKTCWISLFKARTHPPKPQLNNHSCVYTERIFINCSKLHFNPWSAFHWRNCLTGLRLALSCCRAKRQGNKSESWWKLLFVVSFPPPRLFSVMLMEISRDTGISMMAQSCWNSLQTWFHPTFSLFNLSSLTGWKIEISPCWLEPYIAPIHKTLVCAYLVKE